MDGIIIVNKEKGMTSHDVVNKIRYLFKTKKVGHIGTLDPLATGVLIICINRATKLIPFMEKKDKEYHATVLLGESTDTYDLEGKVTETKKIDHINEEQVDEVLKSFVGYQKQIPPIYSAIKINGKKLYEYARSNITIEIEPRYVNIYQLVRTSPIIINNNRAVFEIDTKVSSGTYIRSLCYDIGKKLNIPSLMADLCRNKAGIFTLKNASTLSQIENGKYQLYSMLDILNDEVKINLDNNDSLIKKIINGVVVTKKELIDLNLIKEVPERLVFVYHDQLLAIYDLNLDMYKAMRIWL